MGYFAVGLLVILVLAAWDNGQAQTKNGARRSKNHAGVALSWAFFLALAAVLASGIF